jgi:hypothetical protein
MGFSIHRYAELRPTLWHLTHRQNLDLVRKSRLLEPAELLTTTSDDPRHGQQVISGKPVLRDQDVLHEKSIAFQLGFVMADFLRELNRRVFFWSGWLDRPIRPGRKAAEHYHHTDVLIRVPFCEVVKNHTPYFSRCNSGAPRMQRGKPVPRGPNTWVQEFECEFSESEVVEVTFLEPVRLPAGTHVARSLNGPWEAL